MSVAVSDESRSSCPPEGDGNEESFRKSERLRKRPQFLRTQRRGRRAQGKWVIVYAVANDVGHPRLGLTASRKVGNAVERNLWKRRLREIFRQEKARFGEHHDIVIIIKGGRSLPSYDKLEADVYKVVARALKSLNSRGPRGEKR